MSINAVIVDDDEQKIAVFIELLEEENVRLEEITVCRTGLEARAFLRSRQVDLMILDLRLPMRADGNPRGSGGLDLLDELAERDDYIRPSYIVGVTAYEDLTEEFKASFDDKLISLLHYENRSEQWRTRLITLVKDIQRVMSEKSSKFYKKDLCIITALDRPELKAIKALPLGFGEARLLDEQTYFWEGRLKVGESSYSVVASHAPHMGPVPAATHALKLIHHFKPKVLAMTGICAGVAGKVNYGDVILGSPVWEWQSGKRTLVNGMMRFLSAPRQLGVDQAVVSRYERLIETPRVWSEIRSDWSGTAPVTPLAGRVGPIATGNMVLADGETLQQIQETQHRNIIGIEMEAYSVYAAAEAHPSPRPKTFALKAVCDLGDPDKSDEFQPYAAYTSARALFHFVTTHSEFFFDD